MPKAMHDLIGLGRARRQATLVEGAVGAGVLLRSWLFNFRLTNGFKLRLEEAFMLFIVFGGTRQLLILKDVRHGEAIDQLRDEKLVGQLALRVRVVAPRWPAKLLIEHHMEAGLFVALEEFLIDDGLINVDVTTIKKRLG